MNAQAEQWMSDNDIKNLDTRYRAVMGLPQWVEGSDNHGISITFHQTFNTFGWGPLMVKIDLDGYRIDFPHNDEFQIPPPSCWVKIPHEGERVHE